MLPSFLHVSYLAAMTWFVAAVQTQEVENYLRNSETRHFFGLPFRDRLTPERLKKKRLSFLEKFVPQLRRSERFLCAKRKS
jgi:hypothetical protein